MRGQRFFRKKYTKLPSGSYRWNVLGDGDASLGSGLVRSRDAARAEASACERRLMPAYTAVPRMRKCENMTGTFNARTSAR